MSDKLLRHPYISRTVFHPRISPFEDVFEVDCGDATLACHYREISRDSKTIVFFHGNGEVVSDYAYVFPNIMSILHCNCFLAEYRGYGLSSGVPNLLNLIGDVEHIIRAIPQPLEKLVVFGRSFGSLPAIHAVYKFPEIPGLLLENGIANLLDYLVLFHLPSELSNSIDELYDEVKQHFNHKQKLQGFHGSALITHSLFGNILGVKHAYLLHEWVPGLKYLKLFTQGTHNSIFFDNLKEYCELIYDLIASLP